MFYWLVQTTLTLLLICSSFSREHDHPERSWMLITISTTQFIERNRASFPLNMIPQNIQSLGWELGAGIGNTFSSMHGSCSACVSLSLIPPKELTYPYISPIQALFSRWFSFSPLAGYVSRRVSFSLMHSTNVWSRNLCRAVGFLTLFDIGTNIWQPSGVIQNMIPTPWHYISGYIG